MRGHANPETLAEFREGLLPRRRARQVTGHLAQCSDCAGLDAQLAGLPAVLASTPAPPMPAALTARIEAALAAEAAARAAQTPATGTTAADAHAGITAAGVPAPASPEAGTPSPSLPAHRPPAARTRARGAGRSRLVLGFAAAAAAIVLIGGGGYGLYHLSAGGGATSSAGSGAGPAAGPVPGAGARSAANSAASGAEGLPARISPQAGVVHSGVNYQAAELGRQVTAVMQKYRPAKASLATPSRGARPAATLPGLPRCATSLVAGQRLVFVDVAEYEGRPAVVFVVPGQGGSQRVLVAAADCSGTTGHLLASTTLPG